MLHWLHKSKSDFRSQSSNIESNSFVQIINSKTSINSDFNLRVIPSSVLIAKIPIEIQFQVPKAVSSDFKIPILIYKFRFRMILFRWMNSDCCFYSDAKSISEFDFIFPNSFRSQNSIPKSGMKIDSEAKFPSIRILPTFGMVRFLIQKFRWIPICTLTIILEVQIRRKESRPID